MLDIYMRIKSIRRSMKMSQEELAHLCGYADRSMVARIEAGMIDLPLSKVELFAKALNVTPAYLAGYEENQNRLDISMLNEEGQEKVCDYVADLIDSGKYKKHDFDEMVDRA